MRRAEPHGARIIVIALSVLSTALYGALAQLTGGAVSPLFTGSWSADHRRLALPDQPGAVVGCGFSWSCMAARRSWAPRANRLDVLRWVSQAVVVTSLVFYASATYRRLRMRESRPPDAHEVAAARVRASEAAVAARDEFLAVAAHELRTPLTSMLLHIEAIERTLPAEAAAESTMQVPPTEQKRIAAVARQARRLSGLIDSMLDVSKLTGGTCRWSWRSSTSRRWCARWRSASPPDAAAAACPLTLRLDQPVHGRARRDRLDQIVTNLIGNALKYGAGSPVEIAVEGDETVIRLTVRDHGIGISPADQQRIFRRFERAADERHYSGAGPRALDHQRAGQGAGRRASPCTASPGAGAAFTVGAAAPPDRR